MYLIVFVLFIKEYIFIFTTLYFRYPQYANYSSLMKFSGTIKRGKPLTPAFKQMVNECLSSKETTENDTKAVVVEIKNDGVKHCFEKLREECELEKGIDLFVINIMKVTI